MEKLAKRATGVLLCLAVSVAAAQNQEEEGLSGEVALGYLATSGNAESESLSLSFGGDYYADVWHHALDGRAIRASTSGITTAEAYGLSWQSDRDFGDHSYMFGRFAWDKDKFSGYDKQVRQVVGYGRHIIDSERHKLDGEVGVGARQSDLRDGAQQDETIMRLSLGYEFQLSDTAKFEQDFGIESGSDNTYTESVTALSADIWTDFAIVLSYTVKHNSDVPVDTKKRDTYTAVSLEYSF